MSILFSWIPTWKEQLHFWLPEADNSFLCDTAAVFLPPLVIRGRGTALQDVTSITSSSPLWMKAPPLIRVQCIKKLLLSFPVAEKCLLMCLTVSFQGRGGEKPVACPQEQLTPHASLRKVSNALLENQESHEQVALWTPGGNYVLLYSLDRELFSSYSATGYLRFLHNLLTVNLPIHLFL